MNKVSLKMASDNGADAKKLESIDNRMRRLLADMERQGVTVDMVEGHGRRKLSLVKQSFFVEGKNEKTPAQSGGGHIQLGHPARIHQAEDRSLRLNELR